jgi:hypothetical protein
MIPILTTLSTIQCPHGGQVTLFTSNAEAQVDGGYFLLLSDVHIVAGCPFTVGPKYQPCVTVRWMVGASQTAVHGTPVLLQSSVGLCYSAEQIPQGPPVVVNTQQTAKGL